MKNTEIKKQKEESLENPIFSHSQLDEDNSFVLCWGAKGIGFGDFTFYHDKEKHMCCASEYMGPEFVKKALCAMIDNCRFTEFGEINEVTKPVEATNIDKKPITVKHAELQRSDDNSSFRSDCPVCNDGVLLVGRDNNTFELLAEDNCILCGQKFIYSDIEELKKNDV